MQLYLSGAATHSAQSLPAWVATAAAELYGRVLRVNYAQPMKIKGGDKGWASQPVWADADDWCAWCSGLLGWRGLAGLCSQA